MELWIYAQSSAGMSPAAQRCNRELAVCRRLTRSRRHYKTSFDDFVARAQDHLDVQAVLPDPGGFSSLASWSRPWTTVQNANLR